MIACRPRSRSAVFISHVLGFGMRVRLSVRPHTSAVPDTVACRTHRIVTASALCSSNPRRVVDAGSSYSQRNEPQLLSLRSVVC